MKKFFLVLAAVVAMGFAANAQDNAIGIRFGGGSGYGAELSYQQGLGGNRLEVDLGLSKNTDNYFHRHVPLGSAHQRWFQLVCRTWRPAGLLQQPRPRPRSWRSDWYRV